LKPIIHPSFWYIIANPTAGNGAVERRWKAIEHQLQVLGFSYSVQFTQQKGHATRLVQDALLKGYRNILGIGGDGTNFELINGIMSQTEVPTQDIYYALLPVGTGNDWARTYQISHHIETRLKSLLNPITHLQDIGHVQYYTLDDQPEQVYFANVAGMAYDGFVAKKLEDDGKPNAKIAYLIAVARYLFDYHPSKGRIVWDEAMPVEDHFYTINVGICKYSGGGMQLVPHAIPDDGLFALTFARQIPRWEVLLQTPRFYNGSLLQHSKLTGVQVKTAHIESLNEAPILLEADGEFLGKCPAAFRILEKSLNVVL
jgi:YegS/Rv2252/BmrU family lipid kinase